MKGDLVLEKKLQDFQYEPHAVLGLHNKGNKKVVRVYRPDAPFIFIELFGATEEAKRLSDDGLFECEVPSHTTYFDYKVYHQNGLLSYDPYAFLPTFSTLDQHLFNSGCHYQLHRKMGGRLCIHEGVFGAKFSLWAPGVKSVSLVSDFNHFDGRVNPMRVLGSSGVWELFVPGLNAGEKYKFEIVTESGERIIKSDPYALSYEVRPKTASILSDIHSFQWSDEEWIRKREEVNINRPINVYEVHLGSWKKRGFDFLNYIEIAHELAAYCKDMNYTHVELLPICEHPFDESWGYQVTGFFAPTSRYGDPCQFQYFVDYLHRNGIGVIVDWVPGHFPKDDFALRRFNGTALYEHEDPRQGDHPHWGTHIFNFGRKEVEAFLISSALVWCDIFHIDGLRVDAVASMLYLDYGRNHNEWIPNAYGGKENLEAINFLKHVNSAIHKYFKGVLTIAEESTSFQGISHPLENNGIGFDLKWNMGWMNDTLRYFSKDPIFRSFHHGDLTFGMLYAFSEKFMLVLSHDEVVHGKRSLLSKMPGDLWQKFANVRLLISYLMAFPGKKLTFMGSEIGQWNEWNVKDSIEWSLLNFPLHKGLQNMVKDLNALYLSCKALWEIDFNYTGFEWVDFSDSRNSVISFLRKPADCVNDEILFAIFNFTPQYYPEYFVKLKNVRLIEEIFSSDSEKYGGSNKANMGVKIIPNEGVVFHLSPLGATIYRVRFFYGNEK